MKRLLLIFPLLVAGCAAADDDSPGEYPLVVPRDIASPSPSELGPASTAPPPARYDENVPPNDPSGSGMNMGGGTNRR